MQRISLYLYDCTETELKATETCCIILVCPKIELDIALQIQDTRALGTQNFEIFLLQSVLGEETSCMSTRFLFPGLCIEIVEYMFCRRLAGRYI